MSDTGPTVRSIIDAGLYMVLATADATGRPWSSPVYFAHDAYASFVWVSSPDARHSRNIAGRPEVGVAIFDSHAPIGTGQGVYVSAVAEPVGEDDLAAAIAVFSRRSLGHGGLEWTAEDVRPGSGLRLYRAVAESYAILAKDGSPDHRITAHPA
jgi:hypothetical protein